jgi:TPR repeat protein
MKKIYVFRFCKHLFISLMLKSILCATLFSTQILTAHAAVNPGTPAKPDAAAIAFKEGNFALAFQDWTQRAEKGEAAAQHNLGNLYLSGKGPEKDEAKAMAWFQKAADAGYARAQFNLAEGYRLGVGVEKDIAQAIVWYKKAAEQGLASAQVTLGICHELGLGMPKDMVAANTLYRAAADQHDAEAQFRLARIFALGLGTEVNQRVANIYASQAANQGHAQAQTYLATQHLTGNAVPRDVNLAIHLLAQAARQGHARAFAWLGHIYSEGNGIAADLPRAYLYFSIADKLDTEKEMQDMPNKQKLGLAFRLKTEDIQQAVTLAGEWQVGSLPPKLVLPALKTSKTKPEIYQGQVYYLKD